MDTPFSCCIIVRMEHDENAADLRLTPVASLKGVGPVIAEKLARKGIETVEQLLYFVPVRWVNRGALRKISDLKAGEDVSVVGRVDSYRSLFFRHHRKKGYEVVVADDTGHLSLKWFQWTAGYLKQICHKGTVLFISGRVGQFGEFLQIVHPIVTVLSEDETPDSARTVLPVYSQLEGIRHGTVRNIMEEAVRVFNTRPFGILPPREEERQSLVPFVEAVSCAHGLDGWLDEERSAASVRRMILEEYLQFQATLMAKKRKAHGEKGIAFKTESPTLRRFLDGLPFGLTAGQERVIGEITADMGRGVPMNRLLQGDVGSGKTVCAVAGACVAVDSGFQVAFMAPTEILAEQHYLNVHRWFGDLGIPVVLLKGNMGRQRREALQEIRGGAVPVVIGTHAIIQSDVAFHRLGFVIIDEQHRFGVDQRKRLRAKSLSPDVLNMSATPIPRTLSMVIYGDLDVSVIDTMPGGRQPVKTLVLPEDKRENVKAMVEKELNADRGVFVVYPLIEESETPGMRNATRMAEHLQRSVFPDHRVGLLHGRLNTKDKESIMERFRQKKIDILVCTTVIEVGIDVPHATMIVIENAERFGLSQLHQLRGRVGRGSGPASCILLTSSSRTNIASKRLKIMERTGDGFAIAEEDLRIRGVGDMLGVRQSGMPPFRIGDIVRDIDIMTRARSIAEDYTKTLSDRELEDLVARIGDRFDDTREFSEIA